MKTSLVLLLSFLLLSLLPNPLMANNREPLYDSSGNKVVAGTRYYLVPVFSGDGGGFYTTNPSCPGDLYQESSDSSLGQPVEFRLINYTEEIGSVIYEYTHFYIHFPSQACRLFPNAWAVGGYDDSVGSWIISLWRRISGLQPELWFQFEKFNLGGYVLHFDPPVCESCPTLPKGYVGITYQQSDRRPVLTNFRPLRLKIVKASDVLQVKEGRLNKAKIASIV